MANSRTDPLSPEDRAFLEQEATKAHPLSLTTRAGIVLIAAIIAAALALIAVFAAGLLARLFGYPIANGTWRDHPLTFYGAIVIGGGVLLLQALSYLRWLRQSRRARVAYRTSILADIASKTVAVEDLTVEAIKLLQEPEHHAFIFLMRLSNGKTLVLYDYDSYDADNDFPPENQPKLVARERISLRSFSNSGRRRWAFSGAPVALPVPIELALEPDKWPDDESWCRVKWENIDRHFGPRSAQAAASNRS